MSTYTDIVVINGNWKGGHHASYPKILSVNVDTDRPFGVSEGWRHGLGGSFFTLIELVESELIELFNTDGSLTIYKQIIHAYKRGLDQKVLARELLNCSGRV